MPIVQSSYRPPPGLSHAHGQTVLRALLPGGRVRPSRREVVELEDGDALELEWFLPHAVGAPLVVLCHGLEGSAESSYMRAMVRALLGQGYHALSWSYRGCGQRPNRLARSYHSGGTDDLAVVVERGLAVGAEAVALVGFSLGGNLVLKYLGEGALPERVRAGVAVSAPIDLASSADALDLRAANAVYRRRFLRSLRRKAEEKARRFPGAVPVHDWGAIETVRAFDEAFTAPMHGFVDAADYYARCSALAQLDRLPVPALLLNAQDDPLLGAASFPQELAAGSAVLHLETPEHGGHVAFLERWRPWRSWLEQRVPAFLRSKLG
jgi:uncharacterized protein